MDLLPPPLLLFFLPLVDDFQDEAGHASREDETIVGRGERKMQPSRPGPHDGTGESAVKQEFAKQ